MASKGNNRHLKRLAKSRMLEINPKKALWLIKSAAGAHKTDESIPMLILLREILCIAKNAKEAKRLLSNGEILIDGKIRHSTHYAIGLMDIVSLPKIKKYYQVFSIKGRLKLIEISESDSKIKSCRIVNKTPITGNKVQLNLHDGKNIIIEKEEDQFRVGDTVRITIPECKVDAFLKLEKGSHCYIYRGKHSGRLGILDEIIEQPGGQPSDAKLKVNDQELRTRKDYLFAVSKEFHLD
jgi:small subunit ribosomal protein S4e